MVSVGKAINPPCWIMRLEAGIAWGSLMLRMRVLITGYPLFLKMVIAYQLDFDHAVKTGQVRHELVIRIGEHLLG